MISFDQVLLLEEKVEGAVKKIEQLNAENAALRAKVAELSNALNAKSEQFSSFQTDQSKIEEGILKALSRLNAVENVVLQAAGAAQSVSKPLVQPVAEPQQEQPSEKAEENQTQPSFDTMAPSEPVIEQEEPQNAESIPQEIDLPVQAEPSSDSLSPNIDFEFGDSDSTSQSAVQVQTEQAITKPASPIQEGEPSAQASAQPSQPMFDIF